MKGIEEKLFCGSL